MSSSRAPRWFSPRSSPTGPSIANAATKRLVSVAVNEGIAAADEAMAEIQRPIMRSADFRAGVRSYRENGIGMAEFEGR